MEQVKLWGISLCLVTASCAVIQFILPKNGIGRLVNALCGATILFCTLSPLVRVDWSEVLVFESVLGDGAYNARLQQHLQEQLHQPLQQAVQEAGQAALAPYGIIAEKITAETDIDDTHGIYITEIVVYLDSKEAVRRTMVKEILEQRFETAVTVVEEEG